MCRHWHSVEPHDGTMRNASSTLWAVFWSAHTGSEVNTLFAPAARATASVLVAFVAVHGHAHLKAEFLVVRDVRLVHEIDIADRNSGQNCRAECAIPARIRWHMCGWNSPSSINRSTAAPSRNGRDRLM